MTECPCGNCVCGQKVGNTHICVVLDESLSMSLCFDGTVSGFNEYIQTMQNGENNENVFVTLTKFNTVCSIPFTGIKLSGVPELNEKNYKPNGNTALYDAVVQSINSISSQVDRNDRVLMVIITDGQENSSRNSLQTVKALINAKTELGNWTFTFMGANQDSWLTASTWGIPTANSINYYSTNIGTRSAFVAAASASSAYLNTNESAVSDFYGGTSTVEEGLKELLKVEKTVRGA